MSKILKSTKVINTIIQPQLTQWSLDDLNYKQNLVAAANANPEILDQDEYYRQVVS